MKSLESKTYRPDIDGLRAIAVMAVVLHHFMPDVVTGGYVGVDVFFVISGFLITKILVSESSKGEFSFRAFYARRVRRLLPALFTVIFSVIAVGWFVLLPSDLLATFRAAMGAVLFGANVVFWRDLQEGYFAADAKLNPLLHTWSLGVEEQFYLFFPLALLIAVRIFPRYIGYVLFLVGAISLWISQWWINSYSVAVFFLLPFRAWEFIAGAMLVFAAPPKANPVKLNVIGALGLLGILIPACVYTPGTAFPGLSALPVVAGTVALIYAGLSEKPVVATSFLSLRPAIFIGLISYSLYLWHWPIVVFARFVMEPPLSKTIVVALLLLAIVISWLSWKYIETPFRRRTLNNIVNPLLAGTAIIIVSATGFYNEGFKSRFGGDVLALDEARYPFIPFKGCSANNICKIGSANSEPEMIILGDSHALAWAPGFDMALQKRDSSALLIPVHGCPPLIGVHREGRALCHNTYSKLKEVLMNDANPEWIVVTARWTQYFNNPEWFGDDNGRRGLEALEEALGNTLEIIADSGKRLTVVGPVPEYGKDVPMVLAMSEANGWNEPVKNIKDYLNENKNFYSAVDDLTEGGRKFDFVDVAALMCRPECSFRDGPKVFYRDAHHLSVDGAYNFSEILISSLFREDIVIKTKG